MTWRTCVRCNRDWLCITLSDCGHSAPLSTNGSADLGIRDASSPISSTTPMTSVHRGYKRGIRRLSTGSSARCTGARNRAPHSTPGYPQAPVEDGLYELAFECSLLAATPDTTLAASEGVGSGNRSSVFDTSEGRPAATETALSLAPRPATRGAVVSMPTAHPNTSNQPAREHLEEPLPLSVCVAELIVQLTRES